MKLAIPGFFRRFDIREERKRVGAVLATVAALNLALYLTLNLPRIHRETVEGQRVDAVTQSLSEISRRVGLMRELDHRFDTEKGKVDTFFGDLLGTKETRMIRIQREVRSIAASLGMDPESIGYQPEFLDKVGLVRFSISVPLVGDYRNLRQFINKIENSENFLIIDSVTLGGSRDGGAMLDLSIQLSTFFSAPDMKGPEKPERKPGGRT
jgi:Tfp pilus assembly protein PilO